MSEFYICPKCNGTRFIGYDDASGAECRECGHFIPDNELDDYAFVKIKKSDLARRDEELAELNDRAVFIQFENEDELPADISGNVYDVMFRCSHVDGVRLFPYIEENGQKYFLVMLKEDE
jgi:hypothetical protein